MPREIITVCQLTTCGKLLKPPKHKRADGQGQRYCDRSCAAKAASLERSGRPLRPHHQTTVGRGRLPKGWEP